MRRLIVFASLLGGIGGLINSLRLPFSLHFKLGKSTNIVAALVLFVFISLFGACLCATMGIVEKSPAMIKRGIIAGIISAMLYVSIRMTIDLSVPTHSSMLMMFFGLSGASTLPRSTRAPQHKVSLYVAGGAGGFFSAVFLQGAAIFVSALISAFIRLVCGNAPDRFLMYILSPMLQGALQSLTIWSFIGLSRAAVK